MVFFCADFEHKKELSIEELEAKSLNIGVVDTEQLKELMGIKPELENEDMLPIPEEVAKPSLAADNIQIQPDFLDVNDTEINESELEFSAKDLAELTAEVPVEQTEPETEEVESMDVSELIDSLEEQLSDVTEKPEEVVKETPEIEDSLAEEPILEEEPEIEIAAIDTPQNEQVFEIEKVDSIPKTVTKKSVKKKKTSQKKINQTYNELLKKLQKNKLIAADSTKKGKLSKKDILKVKALIKKQASQLSQKKLNIKYKSPPMTIVMRRDYLQAVNEMLKKHWSSPLELDEDLVVRVTVRIAKNGDILGSEIVETSGNFLLDQSVKDLFRKLKKLVPLPKDYPGVYYETGLSF